MLKNIMWFLSLLIVRTHHMTYPIPKASQCIIWNNGEETIDNRELMLPIYDKIYVEWKTWLWFQWRVECFQYTEPPIHFNCRCVLFPILESTDDSIFREEVLGEFEDKSISYDQFDAEEGFFEEEEDIDESE